MQIPCVYIPGPAPAVSVANNYGHYLLLILCRFGDRFFVQKMGQLSQCVKLILKRSRLLHDTGCALSCQRVHSRPRNGGLGYIYSATKSRNQLLFVITCNIFITFSIAVTSICSGTVTFEIRQRITSNSLHPS